MTLSQQIEPIASENKRDNPGPLKHAQRAECLEGTRTVVLGELFARIKNACGARFLWLNGVAGSGKSSIAQSASIHAARLPDHLVVSIFFSQFGYAGLCDPSSAFQTLACQLCLLDIGYQERVSEVIHKHPDILEKDLRFQYKKLIIELLDAIRRSHSCVLIILDGLDECEPHGVTAVLKVLLADNINHPKGLKILTTSRPEAHLHRIFDTHGDIRKLSLDDIETGSDIRHYLRTSFKQLLVGPFTVPEETISELVKRAGNSFVYAATIVRFVFDEHSQPQDPQMRVDFLLSHRADSEGHPHTRLNALFLSILQRSLPAGATMRRLQEVLGLLVCIREPFQMDKMETFYDLTPRDVKRVLHHLHSLVQVPELDGLALRIYDRSFTDFIVDSRRCADQNLVVDIGSTEKRIFIKCSSLCKLWRQKVVNDLTSPAWTNNRTTFAYPSSSKEEQYACLYWASHLTKIKNVDEKTQHDLDDRCLLRWMETMSLFGMQREAVTCIGQIRKWLVSNSMRFVDQYS